jgi:hypothetical protein
MNDLADMENGRPIEEGDHGPVSERHRLALITQLEKMKDLAGLMIHCVQALPDNDEWFDQLDRHLGVSLIDAGKALGSFRACRECSGEA